MAGTKSAMAAREKMAEKNENSIIIDNTDPETLENNNMGGASVPSSTSADNGSVLIGTDTDWDAPVTMETLKRSRKGRSASTTKLTERDVNQINLLVFKPLSEGKLSGGYIILTQNGDYITKKAQVERYIQDNLPEGITLKEGKAAFTWAKHPKSAFAAAPVTDENRNNELAYQFVACAVVPAVGDQADSDSE